MALLGVVRQHVESMYTGSCDIWEYQKKVDDTGITFFEEILVQKSIPCRLCYKSVQNAADGKAAAITQDIILLLPPDMTVKPGSKVTVTQSGTTVDYKNSGVSAIYESHQEISLILFEGWA